MDILAAGASTQSRARRPLPDGWSAVVVSRGDVYEEWVVEVGRRKFGHRVLTWVFDQGGPVLGFTSPRNFYTLPLLKYVFRLTHKHGLYGPGGVASGLEYEAAELLIDTVGRFLCPGDLQLRWFANGSDACDAAVRLSRAFTGRDRFVSIGYHGSSVVFVNPPQNAGVPKCIAEDRAEVGFGDTKKLKAELETGKIACVIVEVPSTDDKAAGYLSAIQGLCHAHGALFVLDEVVTGFRLALGGAAEHYDVKPDIACYGKALSNGRAISAVVGSDVVMDLLANDVFYSNTYNGDPYNCAHVIGTLSTLIDREEEIYNHLWKIGAALRDGLNELGVTCVGHAPRTAITYEDKETLTKEMVIRGVLLHQPNYAAAAHTTEDVTKTLEAVAEVMT